jgi:hypothetical protein
MTLEEIEQLGVWERQVELAKLWEELSTATYVARDTKGCSPPNLRLRKTEWPGWWLAVDDLTGYQLLEDTDIQRWVLSEAR